ncbi:MAG TPA: hypothetical protein PKO15_13965 [Fibrobacteria bacterium]|nr:hypothetical protein [Fibrobacteria bacterium]HOX51464.1 hypothetical protein [Fibrobacteria bacterium]
MKSILLVLLLAFSSAFAAKPDTSLVLKPDTKRLAASKALDNKLCPVTGEEIGSMGKAPVVVYKGKAVRLCCKGCIKAFAQDPEKYLAIAEGTDSSKVESGHEGHAH